ncbi:HipA domain-containing protein [Cloacibacillus porcorum]
MRRCLCCYGELESGLYHKACSMKLFGSQEPPTIDYTLDELYSKARDKIIESAAVPGVQPKMSMERLSKGGDNKLTFVGLWGDYILKPQSKTYPLLPENEALTMKLAEAAGIPTAPSGLLPLASGELAYLTLRMDRAGIKRYGAKKKLRHMEDFCQITEHMTENKYKGSMELIAKNLRRYSTAPGYDLSVLFDMVVFIFLTGNGDMHLKNFSLLYDGGERRLAPAYDLLSTRLVIAEKDDPEEFAMPMNGKKSNFKEVDFIKFSESEGLNKNHYNRTMVRFAKRLPAMFSLIKQSFLPESARRQYLELLESRAARLNILPDRV